jgi:hypothetical protein
MNNGAFQDTLAANPGAAIRFMLPSGEFVPAHCHITEVGRVQKDFIDCGGTIRSATVCVLQVWVAGDVEHRLDTSKLAHIMRKASCLFSADDLPVEVEYETAVVSQFPVHHAEVTPSGILFHLGTKHTACLAMDRCGVPLPGATSCC